jgi:hypothetical protein
LITEETLLLGSEGKNFGPLALEGSNVFQFRKFDGYPVVEGHVGAKEVVVGDKEDYQGQGSMEAIKPVGRFHMMFEGPIESFDELLVGSVGLRLAVEILESDYLAVLDRCLPGSFCIQKVYSCGIGRVSIGDQDNRLIRPGGADRLFHGHGGRENCPVISHMVGGDLEALGGEEEKDIVMFADDFDVGFIACTDEIDGSFMLKVKAMAIEGGGGGIVEDRLIGKGDIEDRAEHQGGLPGAQGEGDVKGED